MSDYQNILSHVESKFNSERVYNASDIDSLIQLLHDEKDAQLVKDFPVAILKQIARTKSLQKNVHLLLGSLELMITELDIDNADQELVQLRYFFDSERVDKHLRARALALSIDVAESAFKTCKHMIENAKDAVLVGHVLSVVDEYAKIISPYLKVANCLNKKVKAKVKALEIRRRMGAL